MIRRFTCAALAALLLAGVPTATSASQGKGKKHGKHERASNVKGGSPDARAAVEISFSSVDVRVIRHHYAPRYRNLPPGLQKKVARGGQLPPGWQKKFEPFPVRLERELPPLPQGYRRGVIDGHAVIYNSRNNVIIDVAVLF